MNIKQICMSLLGLAFCSSMISSEAAGNVDPFFSPRTISKTPASAPTPKPVPLTLPASIGTTQPKPSAKPKDVLSKPIKPLRPYTIKHRREEEVVAGTIATAAIPAVAAAAWYTNTKVHIASGIIIGGVLLGAVYLWWNQEADRMEEAETATLADETDALFEACCTNNTRALKEVLDKNPLLIAALNKDGLTPLMVACSKGCLRSAVELLDRNAQMEASVQYGTTAIKLAAAYGYVMIVQELIKRGACIEATAHTPYSALMVAAWHGQLEVVKLLLENGANVHARVSFSALEIAQGVMQSDITKREKEIYAAIARELDKARLGY